MIALGARGRSPRRMTKRERRRLAHGVQARRRIEEDIHEFLNPEGVPAAWHDVWEDPDRRDARRTRCTVAFDADVVRFFKAMGPGYQVRMNRVLRAFMELRLSGLLDGPGRQPLRGPAVAGAGGEPAAGEGVGGG